jgi:cell division protein FtsB
MLMMQLILQVKTINHLKIMLMMMAHHKNLEAMLFNKSKMAVHQVQEQVQQKKQVYNKN